MKLHRVCVLGGTGFVGHHLAPRLAATGREVRVLTRRRERHRDLLVLPGLSLVEADVADPKALAAQFQGMDAVINLVGILNEGRGPGHSFRDAHVELPRRVVEACRQAGVRRLLHMSALNADEASGASAYLRSKGEGENLAHTLGKPDIAVTSFRPSIIFGPGDGLFARFAPLLKAAPFMVPLPCAGARFAPVYVGDVVAAMERTLEDRASFGRHYALCGPRSYTFKQLMAFTCRTLGIRRWLIDTGDRISRLQARVLGALPGRLFTLDNYLSMSVDSVCKQNGLQELGIEPASVEAVVPRYLAGAGSRQRYRDFRAHAEHRG